MSSMTLKEFMTRDNGGMEKRGWGVNPDYVVGYNDFWTKNGDPAGKGEALSDLLIGMLIQFGPDLLEGGERGAVAKKKIATFPRLGPQIVSMAEGALNKIPKTLRSMVARNPELYKSWVVGPVVRDINKEAPLFSEEQLKSLNNFDMWQHTPGMAAAFGIPFGIGAILGKPGWGALLGLLGAGGYGYYQYHKMKGDQVDTYNKLKENQALEQEEDAREGAENAKAQEYEDKVKEQSTPEITKSLPLSPEVDSDSAAPNVGLDLTGGEWVDGPAASRKPEPVAPAANTNTNPIASAAIPNPPQNDPAPVIQPPSETLKESDNTDEPDWDSITAGLDDEGTPQAPQPAPVIAPPVEKKNSGQPAAKAIVPASMSVNVNPSEHELHQPWRVVSRDSNGVPTSLWNPKDGMYTKGPGYNEWYRGDGKGWFRGAKASPSMTLALNLASEDRSYILNQNIAGLPKDIFMDELGTVYDGNKNVVGKSVDGKFLPKWDVPDNMWEQFGKDIMGARPLIPGPKEQNLRNLGTPRFKREENALYPSMLETSTYDPYTFGVYPPYQSDNVDNDDDEYKDKYYAAQNLGEARQKVVDKGWGEIPKE